MKIGVLALQGDFREHISMLKKCGVEAVVVRLPEHLDKVDGLIIPGGESTTIGRLMELYGLDKDILRKYQQGMPIYGTCAGLILLAKDIVGSKQLRLGLLDMVVKRNDYGRQIDSFETLLDIEGFDKPFKGVFIRSPVIEEVRDSIKIKAEFLNRPVMAEKDNLLVTTFHPELTSDTRLHKYFISKIRQT